MPRPISVNAVGKPSMITTTISVSISRPSAGSLTFRSPRADALVRGLVDFVGAFDGALAGLVVHERAARELLLDHVDLLGVLQAIRPDAGLQANDAAQDLGDSLDEDEDARDRNDGLERIDRRPVGRNVRMLVDAPRDGGVVEAGVDERHHSRE